MTRLAYRHDVLHRRRAFGLGTAILISAAGVSACGSSASTQAAPSASPTTPAPTLSQTSSAPATPTPTPSATAAPSGAKSASCVNGWVQPAPATDFYRQAVAALEQSEGGTGYVVHAVRYFAGPLATGGIGAIYYLDVRDPRLSARVLLVSGAGPASVAVAKIGTTDWKPADWTAPGGGPLTVRLSPSVAGCLAGS